MQQQSINTTDAAAGNPAGAFCNAGRMDAGLLDNAARILDELVPLVGVSHTDVVEYRVEIPMRYAECFAVLADGRRVAFRDPSKFLGWSSHEPRRSLLFRNNDLTLEVEVDSLAIHRERSTVRSINLQAALRASANRVKKFIGIDGELILLPAL